MHACAGVWARALSGKVKQFPVLCCIFTFISSIVLLVEVV